MYTMKDVCQEVGMQYETLKFYCNEGLVPNVKRDKNNHRRFDDNNIAWIKSLTCLKNCGMSITDMKQYLDLCLQGPPTIPERQMMIKRQQKKIQKEIDRLNECMAYMDWKQQFYKDVLSGKTEYISSLIDFDQNEKEQKIMKIG